MHNTFTRIQNVFGFFTTVAFVLAGFIALTDLASLRTPTASLRAENVQVVKGRPHYYSSKKEEYAIIRFSLDADLSSLFTWNTKQIFVYITAEWPDANGNNTNEAVIWDSIITNPTADRLQNIGPVALRKLQRSAGGKGNDPSRGLLKIKNQKPKYQITHPSGAIASVEDVTLHLHYNVQPWVGMLAWNTNTKIFNWEPLQGGTSNKFGLPAIKKKEDKKTAS